MRTFLYTVFLVFSLSTSLNAASVPETGEGINFPILGDVTFPPTATERNTCDPEFWHVLNNRAWQEAQREITQNANLIPRPDSVLSLSCFDQWLDHLGSYAGYRGLSSQEGQFPGNPQHVWGGGGGGGLLWGTRIALDGLWLNIYLSTGLAGFSMQGPGRFILGGGETTFLLGGNGADPYKPWAGPPAVINLVGTNGHFVYGLLEILVLDQLVSGVSSLSETEDQIFLAACSGDKEYYIDENFPDRMIGDRAIDIPAPYFREEILSFDPQPAPPSSDARDNVAREGYRYQGCRRMNEVWERTRCYDFATESHHILPPGPVNPSTPPAPRQLSSGIMHDAFYPIAEYVNMAAAGSDLRTRANQCGPPITDTIDPSYDFLDLCLIQQHADVLNASPLKFPSLIPPPTGSIPGPLGAAVSAAVSAAEGVFGGPVPGLTSDAEYNFGITGQLPTWASTDIGVNVEPGDPGALDIYSSFLVLFDTTAPCSDPIPTGYIARKAGSTTTNFYTDSVCPTPGCWFNPPTGGTPTAPATGGSCSR